MSRVRNANDFLLEFRSICNRYDRLFAPRIAQIRRKLTGKPEQGILDLNLEAHVRAYVVNALLAALNWRLDLPPEEGLPSLVPEAPVLSQDRESIRFLDYLGLEKRNSNPLMIVETKRANAPLPRTSTSRASSESLRGPACGDPGPHGPPELDYLSVTDALKRGLRGHLLSGEWNAWLRDLTDYLRSVDTQAGTTPKRVVITNGDWLVVFLDPFDAMLKEGDPDQSKIAVFLNRLDIESRYCELFRILEYRCVSGEIPPLSPGQLPFCLEGTEVDRIVHGLRLRYIEIEGIYRCSPVIKLAPVVFIGSPYGGWLRVEAPPREFELPREIAELPAHLTAVQRAAEELLAEVSRRLNISVQPTHLSKHYEDEDEFDSIPGVAEFRPNEYLVVTGDKTHYLLQPPSVIDCRYHDWSNCYADGVPSSLDPILLRSTSPRSFFVSAEPYHCCHRDASSAKASRMTPSNRPRCGPRSGQDLQAFCEIWSFEQCLCCRMCMFQEVCTKAPVFQLPCAR